jgi:hypothetical protein
MLQADMKVLYTSNDMITGGAPLAAKRAGKDVKIIGSTACWVRQVAPCCFCGQGWSREQRPVLPYGLLCA